MHATKRTEAVIHTENNVLLALSPLQDESLVQDFCGTAIAVRDFPCSLPDFTQKTVYLCGDLSKTKFCKANLETAERVLIIRDLSFGYETEHEAWPLIELGRVPILVHGVGIYFRRYFDSGLDYFKAIANEHTFQSLTESNKPAKAHRTGLYLTPVEKDGDDLHFRLLRCSTNLSGPTENFQATDRHIVDGLNQEADRLFQDHAPLNHVLAQIYRNKRAAEGKKQTKARIKAHSDKTKDMPENGIMAFCTFYDDLDQLTPIAGDPFDYGHKKTSGFTKLKFRLKNPADKDLNSMLPAQFSITLYPNSVFLMPLSTNRLYTHEICPSQLDAETLPKRLGYVVRCSSTEAIYRDGQTFLKMDNGLMPLQPPSTEGVADLRQLYADENKTEDFINYGGKFLFSMNQGDYMAPVFQRADEFRTYTLATEGNLYDELMASVEIENVGKGRQGAVLVEPSEVRGIPIVRTTTRYSHLAQCCRPIHRRLAQQIQSRASIQGNFNNALLERYSNTYFKMGAHSDQALDLEEGSFIAIFSCYQYPELARPPRKLVIESKDSDDESFEIPLTHNSVVVFSLETNRRFNHRIVLDKSNHPPENHWLGITFRTSKTFIQWRDQQAYFEDGRRLILANDDQQREFFQLRSRENKEIQFTYPRLSYTLSSSDIFFPNAG